MDDENDIRWRISAARRMLYREGCDSNVGGHVSARAEDREDAFWVTGFEYFDTTMPDRVALLNFDLEPIQGAARRCRPRSTSTPASTANAPT